MYNTLSIELTESQKQEIIDKKYNFIAVFPDGSYKPCYTQKEGVRKVNKWNKNNPCNKICSLYSLRRVIVIKQENKKNIFKRIFNYLTGNY